MADKKLYGELENFSYALGMSIAGNLIQTGVQTVNPELFLSGFKDVFNGEKTLIHPEDANTVLEEFISKMNQEKGTGNLEEGLKFLAVNKKKQEGIELPSGLQYMVLKEGNGEIPTVTDKVQCHYHGTLIDGTVFDSSVERGQPAIFPVNGVIQGWVEALQLMSTGSKWRLFIPSHLAYGVHGTGGAIGPNTTLIFDVELLKII
ncbi:MAG: FKBP-type peptidyl-prolyl cis-trans isomerase [Prolixibacteraceae bacterium]|nr:MAG: FKBP-type peptidyl-prolyl cis-trans isomerase [Prolixibacteraceae bacterium]